MSRHISTLNYLRSAATCLTRTRTVICWLSAPGINGQCQQMSRFPWTLYAKIAGIANFRPCAQILVLPPGDRNQYFRSSGTNHVIASSERLHYFLFDIAYLVMFEFFHAMSTKRTVQGLDPRMKVLRRLDDGIVNVQAMVEEHSWQLLIRRSALQISLGNNC